MATPDDGSSSTEQQAQHPSSLFHPWDSQLPEPPAPVATYVPVVRTGNLLFTAGMLPMRNGALLFRGPVGDDGLALEQAQQAARQAVLNALAAIRAEVGSLARIDRVVKMTVFVLSTAKFFQQPLVANGASHTLVEVLGETVGRHARSAVGVSNLPLEASVEVELVVALKD